MSLGEEIRKAFKLTEMAEKYGVNPHDVDGMDYNSAVQYIQSNANINKAQNPLFNQTVNPPVNDVTDRVAPTVNKSSALYPERAALQKKQRAEDEQRAYAKAIANLSKVERENLDIIIEKGGRLIIESKTLEQMALEGETLNTDALEDLGLIKRDLIVDGGAFGGNMIEFRITGKGRQVHGMFKSQGVL